jgi:hypothetical protein
VEVSNVLKGHMGADALSEIPLREVRIPSAGGLGKQMLERL